jgi:hypothetical protein
MIFKGQSFVEIFEARIGRELKTREKGVLAELWEDQADHYYHVRSIDEIQAREQSEIVEGGF